MTTKNDQDLGEEKIKSIKSKFVKIVRKHVPSLIIKAPQIPRTKSSKIVELAVRNMINGEKIMNIEAISNPESLNFFQNLPQLKV